MNGSCAGYDRRHQRPRAQAHRGGAGPCLLGGNAECLLAPCASPRKHTSRPERRHRRKPRSPVGDWLGRLEGKGGRGPPAGSALRAVRWLRLTGGNIVASKSEAKLFGDVQKHSSTTKSQVKRLVAKARIAQAVYESFSQEQVDAIVKGIGKYVYDNAEILARM